MPYSSIGSGCFDADCFFLGLRFWFLVSAGSSFGAAVCSLSCSAARTLKGGCLGAIYLWGCEDKNGVFNEVYDCGLLRCVK